MYWPDDGSRLRSRRRSRWGLILLFGALLAILGVALLDDWWQVLLPAERKQGALPTVLALTTTPVVGGAGGDTFFSERSASTTTRTPDPTLAVATVAPAATAPDFTLPDLFTDTTTLTLSDYRGRPVILNFWASWCVPCRREMPALQTMATSYAGEGLVLLGMNQTYVDDLSAARAFVGELGLTFPTTRDDTGAVGRDTYQVVGIPTTVFIDGDGKVVHIQIGEMSSEQIAAYTERLIAGEPLQP